MKKFIFPMLLLSLNAFANQEIKIDGQTYILTPKETNTSKDLRNNNSYRFGILTGGSLLSGESEGISISKRFEKYDAFIGIKLLTINSHPDFDSSSSPINLTDGNALIVEGRKFFGNSFNILVGSYYRSANFSKFIPGERESYFTYSLGTVEEGSFEDLGIHISIGNEWRLGNVGIGVDWIGASRSLLTLSDSQEFMASRTGDINELSLLNLNISYNF